MASGIWVNSHLSGNVRSVITRLKSLRNTVAGVAQDCNVGGSVRMNEVIRADTRPPIINTIGVDGVYESLSQYAREISVYAAEMARGDTDDPTETMRRLNKSFNYMMLCMGYLNISEDEIAQAILLSKWHMKLQEQGLENGDTPVTGSLYSQRKFLPPDWMANN